MNIWRAKDVTSFVLCGQTSSNICSLLLGALWYVHLFARTTQTFLFALCHSLRFAFSLVLRTHYCDTVSSIISTFLDACNSGSNWLINIFLSYWLLFDLLYLYKCVFIMSYIYYTGCSRKRVPELVNFLFRDEKLVKRTK